MSGNVIRLPRPRDARPTPERLGLYLRVGRNQHHELREALGSGEGDFHGVVIDAIFAKRHAELKSRALQLGLDVVLDPKTHAMALPGSHTTTMAGLPWGEDRHHTITSFSGASGRIISQKIAEFCLEYQFTQVLGPTHILIGKDDPWLRQDIENVNYLQEHLKSLGSEVQVIYPLAMPMQVFRNPLERWGIIQALGDISTHALWLRIENFGSDATGEKTVAYIEAAREFHALGIPVIADHAGGLTGIGLLAFGAVGGLSHGITLLEGFKAAHWRKPPKQDSKGGATFTRVYIPQLDLHLKREEAREFLGSSTRTQGRYGCRDTHCCPGGVRDMLQNPTRHFVHQRSSEVQAISRVPESIRPQEYIEQSVRRRSDHIAAAAGLRAISDEFREKLQAKQSAMSRYRLSIGHFAEKESTYSVAQCPPTRQDRQNRK